MAKKSTTVTKEMPFLKGTGHEINYKKIDKEGRSIPNEGTRDDLMYKDPPVLYQKTEIACD
jgi:hypothetical protein